MKEIVRLVPYFEFKDKSILYQQHARKCFLRSAKYFCAKTAKKTLSIRVKIQVGTGEKHRERNKK